MDRGAGLAATRITIEDSIALIASRAPTVLVADDTAVNRLVATYVLEQLGCPVRTAVTGRAAVAAVRAGGIDMVLMDILMPEMDGLAATRAIRALSGPYGAIPIIGLSGTAHDADDGKARAAGMDGFATKPVNRDRLAAEMAKAFRFGVVAAPISDTSALANLRTVLGDDIVEMVIAAFEDNTPATMRELRCNAEARNLPRVAQAAHALAGNAATLGLPRLTEAANRVEHDAGHGIAPSPGALDLIDTEFAAALAALRPAPII